MSFCFMYLVLCTKSGFLISKKLSLLGEGRGLDKYQKKKLSIDFKRQRKALQMNSGENKIVQSFLRPSQKVFTLRLVTKKITK